MENFLTPEEYYAGSGDPSTVRSLNMEHDPDGNNQQVAVIMTGQVYREAGLKHSKHPEVEGQLYDKLCQIGKHKLRDEVRRMAISLALMVNDKEFKPTVAWLDNFMRRFCLSKKKMGFYSAAMLTQLSKKKSGVASSTMPSVTQDDILNVLGINGNGGSNGQSSSDCNMNGDQATSEHAVMENGTNGSVVLTETEDMNNEMAEKNMSTSKNDLASNNLSSQDLLSVPVDGVNSTEKNQGSLDQKIKDEVLNMETSQEENKESMENDKNKDDSAKEKDDDTENKDDNTGKQGDAKEKDDNAEKKDTKERKTEDGKDGVRDSSKDGETENEDNTSNSNESETSTEEISDEVTTVEESDDENDEGKEEKEGETSSKKTKQEEDEDINYSKREKKYYRKNIDELQKRLKGSVVKCTSCNEQVNHNIRTLVHTHPVLGVFICKRCRKYYGRGKYCKDDEGYDEYCRLCAEGGDLLCCEVEGCFNGFCKRCIKRTMGRSELKSAETTENWSCYVCDPTPMMDLRSLHRAILSNLKDSEEEDTSLSRKEMKTKSLKNKFEILKQKRQELSQKEQEKEELCNSKRAGANKKETTDKKKEAAAKKKAETNKKRDSSRLQKNDENKEDESNIPSSLLKEVIENMSEMMNKCLQNVSKIEQKWKKSKYSPEGTDKARHHLLKQLEAVCNNFQIMENDLKEEKYQETLKIQNEMVDDAGEEEGEKKDSGKGGTQKKIEIKKEKDHSQSEEDSCSKTEKKKPKKISDAKKAEKRKRNTTNTDSDNNSQGDNEADDTNALGASKHDKEVSEKDKTATKSSADLLFEKEIKSDKTCSQKKGDQPFPDLESVIDGLMSDADDTSNCVLGDGVADSDNLDETVAMMETSMETTIDAIHLPEVMQGNKTDTEGSKICKDKGDRKDKNEKDDKDDQEDKENDDDKGDIEMSKEDKENEDEEEENDKGDIEMSKEDKENDDDEEENTDKGDKEKSEVDKSVEECPEPRSRRGRKAKENPKTESEEDTRTKSGPTRKSSRFVSKKSVEDESEGEGRRKLRRKSSRRESVNEEEEKPSRRIKKDKTKKEETEKEADADTDCEKKTKKNIKGKKPMKDEEKEEEQVDEEKIEDSSSVRKTKKDNKVEKEEEEEDKEREEDEEEEDKNDKEREEDEEEEDKNDNDNSVSKSKKREESNSRKGCSKKKEVASSENEEGEKKKRRKSSTEDKKETERDGEQVKRKRGRAQKKKGEENNKKMHGSSDDKQEEEESPKGKVNRLKKSNSKESEEEEDEKEEKRKLAKRRKRKRLKLDKEDEVLLGLVEDSSGTSEEEDTDTEIQRRREEHMDKRTEKKKKQKKKKEDQDDDNESKGEEAGSEEVEDKKDGEEDSSRNKANKEKKKKADKDGSNEDKSTKEGESDDKSESNDKRSKHSECSPKKKEPKDKKTKENEKALSSLLASDSDKENYDQPEKCERNSSKEDKTSVPGTSGEEDEKETEADEKKQKEKKTSGTSGSEAEVEVKKKKKKLSSGKSSAKSENRKAKDALLNSDSDEEKKPKPRSKKRGFRNISKIMASTRIRALDKLTEDEREELQESQLEGKCEVVVTSLRSKVREELKEEEFVYASDYPELLNPRIFSDQNEDCDADEEDSDKEFSKLMNYKLDKASKGGKKKTSSKSDSEQGEEDKEENDEDKEKKEKGKDIKNSKKECSKKEGTKKEKKEGLLDIDIDKEDEDDDDEEEEEEDDKKKKKKKDGGISLNEKMKKQILMSSDEEGDDEEEEEEEPEGDFPKDGQTEEEKERKKHELRKKKEEEKKAAGSDASDEENAPRVQKKGYMNLNMSTDEEDKDVQASDYNDDDDEEEEEEEDNDDENDSDFEESPRKRRTFQLSSSDSEDGKKKKKKRKASSSEYESEDDEKPKSKRKRIKKMSSTSSDNDDDDDDDEQDSPSKHKKLRRMIHDEDLTETTKNAAQEEEERRERVAERQKNYNKIFEIDVESDQKDIGKLVLDFDSETKTELISVNEKLIKFLKPHQFKGIKFMWDATIESLEMLKEKPGSGCILAHCMGLGKTLQVIAFCHTLLTNKKTSRKIQRVMVCCPVNTVYNWVAEFNTWLKGKMLPFDVIELTSAKDLWGRAYRLDDWWREGGICVIGYDMFRNLSNSKSKKFKGKMKEIFQKSLIDPGPDLMVCDEGHVLKNEKTALSIAINQIKTSRRIILTGTPLQNNLKEYHCMIQFVKPNLMGTKKEFMNRFVNPIEQGQCSEAMPRDVRRMKRRAHILHNMLEGCVQRYDYTVLKPFLPPKFEYVISVQLSKIQIKLYQYYLDNLAQGGPKRQGSGLFVDFGALSRVWTHPRVLELAVRRAQFNDDEEEMADFICDETTTDSSEDERTRKKKKNDKKKKDEESEKNESEVEAIETENPGPIPGLTESGKVRVDWWKKVLMDNVGEDFEENDYLDKLEHSGKLLLLLDILRECTSIGDKVLVFSQSLLALDMIEDFLQMISDGNLKLPEPDNPLPLPFKRWRKDQDYQRLDGSTSADTRKTQCKFFNSTTNERCRLFLISTRAGGLGINLVAANRVIVFDSSWNPSHDTQSIFRVYRFGQKKPCYIYRFVAQGTMEEKIYSRQVNKMSTALRVVDEHQIKRYFKMEDLAQLYEFTPADVNTRETPIVPEDRLLAEMLKRQKDWIVDYHEQDSLLENQTSEELSEEERKAAWEDYENEKKGFMVQNQRNTVMSVVGNPTMMPGSGMPSLSLSPFSFDGVVNTIKAQNPNLTQAEMCESVVLATKQIQKIHLNHYQRVQAMVYNLKNPMIAPEQRKLLPFGNHPEMLPMLEQQLRVLEENIQYENKVITRLTQITPQSAEISMANLMAAGLIHGHPPSTGMASTSNYVNHPSAVAIRQQQLQQQPMEAEDKNRGSNDVIMLD